MLSVNTVYGRGRRPGAGGEQRLELEDHVVAAAPRLELTLDALAAPPEAPSLNRPARASRPAWDGSGAACSRSPPTRGHARAHVADQVEAPAERVVDRREAGGRALVPGDLLERGAEHAHVAAGPWPDAVKWDASLVSCGLRNVTAGAGGLADAPGADNVGPVPRWKPRTSPPRRRRASTRRASRCAGSASRCCRPGRGRTRGGRVRARQSGLGGGLERRSSRRPATFARAVAPDMPGFGRADKPRDFQYSRRRAKPGSSTRC